MKKKLASWTFLIFGLVLALAVLSFTRFSTQVLELLPRDLRSVHALEIYEHFFLKERQVVVLVEASRPIDSKLLVKAIHDLRQRTKLQSPLQNLEPSHFNTGGDALSKAAGLLSLNSADLENLIDLSDQEKPPPVFLDIPNFILMEAVVTNGINGVAEARSWLQETLVKVSADCGIDPGVLTSQITGKPVFTHDINVYLRKQLIGTFIFTIIIGILAGWILTRDMSPFRFMVAMSLCSVAGTLLLLQFIFGQVNGVAVAFGSLMFGLAVDYAILVHFGAHEESHLPWVKRRLMRGLLGGWTTTVGGFVILVASTFPGIRQLGAGVAIGLTICISGTIIWSYFHGRSDSSSALPHTPLVFLEWLQRFRGGILAVLVAICVFGILISFREVDRIADFSTTRIQPSIPAQQTLNHIQTLSSGGNSPFFVLVGPTDLETVRQSMPKIQDIFLRAEKENILSRSLSLDLPSIASIESNLKVFKKYLNKSNEQTKNLQSIDFDITPEEDWRVIADIIQQWSKLSAQEVLKIILSNHPLIALKGNQFCALALAWPGSMGEAQAATRLRELVAQTSIPQTHIASWPLLAQELARLGMHQFGKMALIALLIVLVILWFTLKSWELLVKTLACQLFAMLLACGLLLLFHIPWTLMSMTVLVMVFGVSEDYYIHLGLAAQAGRNEFAQTHLAVSACAVTTLASFATLAFLGGSSLGNLGSVGFIVFITQACMALCVFPFFGKQGRYQNI